MSQLHDTLVENYAKHYARANTSTDPRKLSTKVDRSMQLMFGSMLAGLPEGSRVLDLGCGTGFLLRWLATHRNIVPVGVDACRDQIEQARAALPGLELHCSDGLAFLRRHEGEFAAVFCFDTLEHIPGNDLCWEWVRAIHAALRPDGFCAIRVPNAANLTAAYTRYMDLTHVRSFTRTSLLQLMEAGGFADCRPIPIRAAHFTGRVRELMERVMHLAVFRICGKGREYIVTSNIVGYGRKCA